MQVFSASRPELIHPFTGLSPAQFHRLVRLVAQRGGDGRRRLPRQPEVIMPYRKPRDGSELPDWKQDYNPGHRKVRARVEHCLARLKTYKILRDYRRAARTLATTATGSHLHNIALAD